MLHRIKKLIPKSVLQFYHFSLAYISKWVYRNPSQHIYVIGVTGTNGKSSTVQFIAQILTLLGERVGYTTTAGFSIAGKEIENKMKMTMPGRFLLQKFLRRMIKEDCTYAIVETSSQGIVQYRHMGIEYDMAVFTNLTPEHLESHGGFQNYKKAKGKLFSHTASRPKKVIDGEQVPTISVVNADDPHSEYYAQFPVDRVIWYGWHEDKNHKDAIVAITHHVGKTGIDIEVNGVAMHIPMQAEYQQLNMLTAISAVHGLGYSLERIAEVVKDVQPIAGRFDLVHMGQDFSVVVDYAYEPYAIEALLHSVAALKPNRIIGVHGSAGGGRDVGRRYQIGRLAAQKEDIVIVTNEDPYDEDPRMIIEQVAKGALDAGKKEGENLHLVDDRAEAIALAISLAEEGDTVLITGKGSEPVMAVAGGKKIPWSDKNVAIDALKKQGYAA